MDGGNKELTQDQLALIFHALRAYFAMTTQFNHSTTSTEIIVMHEIDNILCKLGLPPLGVYAVMRPSYFDKTFICVDDDFSTRHYLEPETEKYIEYWQQITETED